MKVVKSIMLLILISNSLFYGSGELLNSTDFMKTDPNTSSYVLGTPGTIATQSPESCRDSAFVYMHCREWLVNNPVKSSDFLGTTVIIDQGLRREQYNYLEEHLNERNLDGTPKMSVDIIRYLTPASDGSVGTIYGNYGEDNLSPWRVSDSDLEYVSGYDHGLKVAASFGALARGARVIFIPTQNGIGFSAMDKDYRVWQWIYNNIETYNIRVISMSWAIKGTSSDPSSTAVRNYISAISGKGVMMLAAMGNDGKKTSRSSFPVNQPGVRGVGSIDHENRGDYFDPQDPNNWQTTKWDPTFYSGKDRFSGTTNQGKFYKSGCYDRFSTPFCSAWGDNDTSYKTHTDFVMPGNGVPTAYWTQVWYTYTAVYYYAFGTSISTPYLAAASIIAYHGYILGYLSNGGRSYLSISPDIYGILKASSFSPIGGWDQKYGWGTVKLDDVYSNAYALGKYDASYSNSGGNTGGNTGFS